jgi:uncharacterized protein (DUF433 family)
MSLSLAIEPVPLWTDEHGVVRIEGTRVTLDTLISSYKRGHSAEEIVEQYPSVSLADVYAVIGYYLRRRDEVERYLEERQREAREIRARHEAKCDPGNIRERLLARRKGSEAS